MNTKVIKIDLSQPLDFQLKPAVGIIKKGGLVAFPTETVYGLGASGLNADASKKIYEAKGRPSDNPLIIHISKAEDAEKYCYVDDNYYKLAKKFMPGPITVILKKKSIVPNEITANLDTVAVRCPENIIANKFIELCDLPIAAPSANLSGKPSPTKAMHVIDDMMGKIDCIIDGGDCDIGVESTIVKLDSNKCYMLRPGGITIKQLKEVFDEVILDKAVLSKLGEGEKPLAPGMKYKHYAPRANVNLILRNGEEKHDNDIILYINNCIKHKKGKFGVLAPSELLGQIDCDYKFDLGNKDDEITQAQLLFDKLRMIDKSDVEVVYAVINREDEEIGLAIYNRMIKASGFNIIKI